MEPPPGALQRAVFVAVPLALIVLIFVTPSLIAPEQPQPTDIPLLLIRVTGEAWNGTVNETAILYVRSALGVPLYDRIEIALVGLEGLSNVSANATVMPSLIVKIPVHDGWSGNVSAMAVFEETTFRLNATVTFVWDEAGWLLEVQPEQASSPREYREVYTASMRREVPP